MGMTHNVIIIHAHNKHHSTFFVMIVLNGFFMGYL